MQFRKKPVVIEAYQMTPEAKKDHESWPTWLQEAEAKQEHEAGAVYFVVLPGQERGMFVRTLEGSMLVADNAWMIQGVQGELYPCDDTIFRQTYDPADAVQELIVTPAPKIVNSTDHALVCHVDGPGSIDDPGSGLVEAGFPLIPGEEMDVPEEAVLLSIKSRPDHLKYAKNGVDVRTGEQV